MRHRHHGYALLQTFLRIRAGRTRALATSQSFTRMTTTDHRTHHMVIDCLSVRKQNWCLGTSAAAGAKQTPSERDSTPIPKKRDSGKIPVIIWPTQLFRWPKCAGTSRSLALHYHSIWFNFPFISAFRLLIHHFAKLPGWFLSAKVP